MEINGVMENKHPLTVFREQRDLTQDELAALIGVKAPAVCKWEKGRVSYGKVLDVERVTGIPRHELRPDIYPDPALQAVGT